jgi:hypothetical protein
VEKRGEQYQVVVEIIPKYRGSFNTLVFGDITSIRHIDPKTSVKLQSEASCPESKAAMTTMVVDQSENSSPVKSPLKMWRLSD